MAWLAGRIGVGGSVILGLCACHGAASTGAGGGGGTGGHGVSSSSHASSTGGPTSSGTGGSPTKCEAMACVTETTCPTPETVCLLPACADECCGATPAAAGTPCSDHGGVVCDGKGACVACVNSLDCSGICVNGACNDPVALAVPGGYNHACAILADGSVWCWGANESGEIGDGTQTQRNVPTRAKLPKAATAVSANGSLFGYTCAVLVDKTLWCWGDNASGELGVGQKVANASTPQQVPLQGVTQVSAGGDHACALAGGHSYCWGANGFGQVGDGSAIAEVPAPAKIGGAGVVVSAGGSHTCAVDTGAGDVSCWGDDAHGELGDGMTTMSPVATAVQAGVVSGVDLLAAGASATCAGEKGGSVYCWGSNASGQLGIGETTDQSTPTALSLTGATVLGLGVAHAGAVTPAGLFMWGSNSIGQLGDGHWLDQTTPERIDLQPGVAALSLAGYSTCALTTDRKVYCWGANDKGQLGNGTTDDSPAPGPVVWPF
jgi:alpha-tubulin suppressor-like RCC1 family protein